MFWGYRPPSATTALATLGILGHSSRPLDRQRRYRSPDLSLLSHKLVIQKNPTLGFIFGTIYCSFRLTPCKGLINLPLDTLNDIPADECINSLFSVREFESIKE